jgi:proteasome lid subunit RPN8/RPN11
MEPRILVTPEAMARLMGYVRSCKGEVSGLGRVTLLPSGDFLVTEVALLRQESDYGGTHIGEQALAEFLNARLDRGENIGEWRLWWHSHADFRAFWSDTDEDMCAAFNGEWMLAIVANHRGDLLGRVDIYKPVHVAVELPVAVHVLLTETELAAVEAEVREKVTAPPRPRYGRGWWPGDEEEGKPDEVAPYRQERRMERRDTWYLVRGRPASAPKKRFSSPST